MELILIVKLIQLLSWVFILGAMVTFLIAAQRRLRKMCVTQKMHIDLDRIYAESGRAIIDATHEVGK